MSHRKAIESRSGHKEVWVKVNAYVDEGVAELVVALSQFPRLRTTSSCQGNPDQGQGRLPSIWFTYGQDGEETVIDFVAELAPRLMEMVHDDAYLSICWNSGPYPCFSSGLLSVRPERTAAVARALKKLAREWEPLVDQDRP